MTLNELQNKIQNAKALDFGDIFNKCIDLFKKIWLKGFVVVLIVAIISWALIFLFGLLGLGPDPFDMSQGVGFDFYKTIQTNSLYSIPQTIILSSISLALLAAYYRICKQVDLGETQSDDYFYFFKGDYIGKVFVLGAIYAVIATIAQLLFFIPYIYVYVPLAYFAIIFANNPELSEKEILKTSFNLGNKKWLITFGLNFVCALIGIIVGLLACGIGMLFTISIVYLPVYFIYKEIVGFEGNSEIDLIGKPEDF